MKDIENKEPVGLDEHYIYMKLCQQFELDLKDDAITLIGSPEIVNKFKDIWKRLKLEDLKEDLNRIFIKLMLAIIHEDFKNTNNFIDKNKLN